jgi:lysophospholipase L1-like esterase
MKKLIIFLSLSFTALALSGCTTETSTPTCPSGYELNDNNQCTLIQIENTASPYDYLYDAGCSVSEVTILTNRSLFDSLTQDQIDQYNLDNSETDCAIHHLIDDIKETHQDEVYQSIMLDRFIDTSLEAAQIELALVRDGLTLDVNATNYAIRANNIADYIITRDTYGLGGYFYNYFTSVNEWRYTNQFEEDGQIVFLGSSVVEAHNFDYYFPNQDILNRGIGGDYTDGFSNRLDVSVYDVNPSKLFFYCGGNDYAQGRTPQEITDLVENILIDMLQHLDADQIYLVSVYPVNEDKANIPHNQSLIDQQNVLYEALAETYGIHFADVSNVLMNEEGQMKAEFTSDGIHMNGDAYTVLSEAFRPYIEE